MFACPECGREWDSPAAAEACCDLAWLESTRHHHR